MHIEFRWWPGVLLYRGPSFHHRVSPCQSHRIYIGAPEALCPRPGTLEPVPGPVAVLEAGEPHEVRSTGLPITCLIVDRSRPADQLRALAAKILAEEPSGVGPAPALPTSRVQAWLTSITERQGRLPARADELQRLQRGLRVIRRQPGEAGVLESAAAASDWSASRFRHLARARLGMSLKRYRLWAKLLKAIALASEGQDLTSAALGAGFSSSSHFSAAHRALFGTSASAILPALRAGVRTSVGRSVARAELVDQSRMTRPREVGLNYEHAAAYVPCDSAWRL